MIINMRIIIIITWKNLHMARFTGLDCQKGNGETYRGTVSKNKGGNQCQKWTNQYPNIHKYNSPFAQTYSGIGEHNYCRNPDGSKGVWCYGISGKRWDYCNVPTCGNFKNDNEDKDYDKERSEESSNEVIPIKAPPEDYEEEAQIPNLAVGCYLQGNCANNKRDYSQRTYDDYGCKNNNACSDKTACMERGEHIHKFCENTFEQQFKSIFVDTTGVETVYSFPKGGNVNDMENDYENVNNKGRCKGEDNGCCTAKKPCAQNEGDCDSNSECLDGLVCGNNNCVWEDNDDCCENDIVGENVNDMENDYGNVNNKECCGLIHIHSTGGAEEYQPGRLGYYSNEGGETHDNRPIYRQYEGNNSLYYRDAEGWIVSTQSAKNESPGGFRSKSESTCPNKAVNWLYYDAYNDTYSRVDKTLNISCSVDGEVNQNYEESGKLKSEKKKSEKKGFKKSVSKTKKEGNFSTEWTFSSNTTSEIKVLSPTGLGADNISLGVGLQGIGAKSDTFGEMVKVTITTIITNVTTRITYSNGTIAKAYKITYKLDPGNGSKPLTKEWWESDNKKRIPNPEKSNEQKIKYQDKMINTTETTVTTYPNGTVTKIHKITTKTHSVDGNEPFTKVWWKSNNGKIIAHPEEKEADNEIRHLHRTLQSHAYQRKQAKKGDKKEKSEKSDEPRIIDKTITRMKNVTKRIRYPNSIVIGDNKAQQHGSTVSENGKLKETESEIKQPRKKFHFNTKRVGGSESGRGERKYDKFESKQRRVYKSKSEESDNIPESHKLKGQISQNRQSLESEKRSIYRSESEKSETDGKPSHERRAFKSRNKELDGDKFLYKEPGGKSGNQQSGSRYTNKYKIKIPINDHLKDILTTISNSSMLLMKNNIPIWITGKYGQNSKQKYSLQKEGLSNVLKQPESNHQNIYKIQIPINDYLINILTSITNRSMLSAKNDKSIRITGKYVPILSTKKMKGLTIEFQEDKNKDIDMFARSKNSFSSGGKRSNEKDEDVTTECQKGNGETYRGIMDKNKVGIQCQKWTDQFPNIHYQMAPDRQKAGGTGRHNYCRNPDGAEGVWCYGLSGKRWDYCNVPKCDGEQRNENVENDEVVIDKIWTKSSEDKSDEIKSDKIDGEQRYENDEDVVDRIGTKPSEDKSDEIKSDKIAGEQSNVNDEHIKTKEGIKISGDKSIELNSEGTADEWSNKNDEDMKNKNGIKASIDKTIELKSEETVFVKRMLQELLRPYLQNDGVNCDGKSRKAATCAVCGNNPIHCGGKNSNCKLKDDTCIKLPGNSGQDRSSESNKMKLKIQGEIYMTLEQESE